MSKLIQSQMLQGHITQENQYLYVDLTLHSSTMKPITHTLKARYPEYETFKDVTDLLHISLIYPEEVDKSANLDTHVGQLIEGTLTDIISVIIDNREYIAIRVLSKQATLIRQQNNLSEDLDFRGVIVPFHITLLKSRKH